MARPASLSQAKVEAAMAQLARDGKSLSHENIRKITGGSVLSISRYKTAIFSQKFSVITVLQASLAELQEKVQSLEKIAGQSR